MKEDNVSQLCDYDIMTIHPVNKNECMGFSYIYLFKFKSFGQLVTPDPPLLQRKKTCCNFWYLLSSTKDTVPTVYLTCTNSLQSV